MSRIRYDNQGGFLGADPGSGGTTITFAVAPDFATITGSDYIPISLDPGILSSSEDHEPNAGTVPIRDTLGSVDSKSRGKEEKKPNHQQGST